MPDYSETFSLETDGPASLTPAQKVVTRVSDKTGVLAVSLDRDAAARLTAVTNVRTGFRYARASGGSYGTRLTLSDMDRKMLDAAFRFCL